MTKINPTIQDVLDVINVFSSQVDARFEQIDKRFEQVDKRFEQVDKRFEQIDKRFEQVDKRFELIESRVSRIENKMVTKDYLADVAADLKTDSQKTIKRQDQKVNSLIELLNEKKILDSKEKDKLLEMPSL